jgi:hypothetical protein
MFFYDDAYVFSGIFKIGFGLHNIYYTTQQDAIKISGVRNSDLTP